MMNWSSVLPCFAGRRGFGRRVSWQLRGGVGGARSRAWRAAVNRGPACVERSIRQWHPWGLTASGRSGLMDALIYQFGFGFFEAAL